MMERVRAGEINLICVKDFSRFSRDYIETGNYLECVFPFLGVRFLSINDGYDSDNYKGTTGGIEVVMKSIIYASYSKDLSIKTTTAKIQMMKQGKYVGAYPPYGYTLHPAQRNKLALDPEAAAFVRRIFEEALENSNTAQIARGLNRDHVPTPGQYFRSRHPENGKFGQMSDKITWTAAMVYKILTNYVYTGAAVGHKRRSAGLGTKKSLPQKREDWIIVEGMHEAIVSKEEFSAAQRVIKGGIKNPTRISHSYPLKGLVRCGNCGRVMSRREQAGGTFFFTCGHSNWDSDTVCAVGKRYQEADLEQLAFHAVSRLLNLADQQPREKKTRVSVRTAARDCITSLKVLQNQLEQLKGKKLQWYEKYATGDISKSEYLQKKAELDKEISALEAKARESSERLEALESERPSSDGPLDSACCRYAGTTELTWELVHAFLEAIYVFPNDQVELKWKFKDCFNPAP